MPLIGDAPHRVYELAVERVAPSRLFPSPEAAEAHRRALERIGAWLEAEGATLSAGIYRRAAAEIAAELGQLEQLGEVPDLATWAKNRG